MGETDMRTLPRSRWQFWQRFASLPMRLLFGVVVAIGALFAWLAYRAHSQRVIVAAIEKAGGKVWYDFEVPDASATVARSIVISPSTGWLFYAWEWIKNLPQNLRMGPDSGPRWLLDWLGPDYFGHVAWVSLTSRASDADLVHVGSTRQSREARSAQLGRDGRGPGSAQEPVATAHSLPRADQNR